jgi:hypothetical protein
MNLKHLTIATVIATFGLAIPILLSAQNPPASTYRPGVWQPVARVDVKRPIAIKLVNETDVTLDYDLTNNIKPSPQQISPGKTSELKEIPLPAYILINPTDASSTPGSPSFNLQYDVAVSQDNTITVTIRKIDRDVPGNTTLNLNETGAIYVY